jgi:hypothetical protein
MTRQPTITERRGHWAAGGDFTPGSPFLNGVPIATVVPLGGADRSRIRFKATGAGGTLAARFVRPDGQDTAYATTQPADTPITVNVEATIDLNPHFGEGLMKLTFTPAGNGNIAFCDVSQS